MYVVQMEWGLYVLHSAIDNCIADIVNWSGEEMYPQYMCILLYVKSYLV